MGCMQSCRQIVQGDKKSKDSISTGDGSSRGDDTFTPRQKRILRETWACLADKKKEKGMEIFLNIFYQCPRAKGLFPFRDLEGDDLLRDQIFKCHSLRFMNAVESTIHSIDALEVTLIPVLHNLGKVHASTVEHLPRYLPVFLTSILIVFEGELGAAFTDEVKDTWGQLATFIALKMLEGYHYGVYKKNGRRRSVGQHGRYSVTVKTHVNNSTLPPRTDTTSAQSSAAANADCSLELIHTETSQPNVPMLQESLIAQSQNGNDIDSDQDENSLTTQESDDVCNHDAPVSPDDNDCDQDTTLPPSHYTDHFNCRFTSNSHESDAVTHSSNRDVFCFARGRSEDSERERAKLLLSADDDVFR